MDSIPSKRERDEDNKNLTCDMKIPGSLAPNGTQEWSVPPIMLKPSDPPSFTNVTSWNKEISICNKNTINNDSAKKRKPIYKSQLY